ncbi:hypothetical protein CIB84_001469, partial [Bambusicola thoracicus]
DFNLHCVRKVRNVPKDFIKENGHLYEEDRFIPENFFRLFNSTIEVYKEFADSLDKNDCIMPSTVETPENDSRVAVTKTISFPPVAASSLRNDSIGSNTSSNSNKEALGFISSSSLQGISIALTSLLSLLIGFVLGAIYWKVRSISLNCLHSYTIFHGYREAGRTE